MKLNLGCGNKYLSDWVNVDASPWVRSDLNFNLNRRRWPLPDNCADEVEMNAVLEHLNDTMAVMSELHRIMKVGAMVHIHVPYAGSVWAFQDPTHKRFFTERTFKYFEDGFDYNFYTHVRFEIVKCELYSGTNSLLARIRNLIPFRSVLRWFLWNMYDGVDVILRKPMTYK